MDDFLNKLKSLSNPNDMPVTMVGPNDHYYIHIYFENLIFCAVLREETCPLMVTEFLHRIKDIFIDYFGVCNVDSIKARFLLARHPQNLALRHQASLGTSKGKFCDSL